MLLLGESHGQRSLEGYSSWGHKESDTTEVTADMHMFSTTTAMQVACYRWAVMTALFTNVPRVTPPAGGEKEVPMTATWGWKPRLPTISNDTAKVWRRPHYQTVGLKVLAPYLAFSDTTGQVAGGVLSQLYKDGNLGFLLSLCW